MDNVLLLGFGTQATEFIKVIKEKNYFLTASDLRKYYELENNQILMSKVDKFIEYENFHLETFYKVATEANNVKSLKAVIPLADGHVVPAALMQEKLGLKGPGLHAASISVNKAMQRHLFKMEGLPIPAYCQFDFSQGKVALKNLNYPLVLKPVNMFGSIGVKIVYNYEEALNHLEELKKHSEVFLAEEYIEGEEVSVESIVQNQEILFTNITKKLVGPKPLFVEEGHIVPHPDLNENMTKQILEVNKKVIHALVVKDSIVHLEMKITPKGPIIIEVAVRMPGDRIMELIEHSTGINMYSAFVDILTGNKPNLTITQENYSGVKWFSAPREGKIQKFIGIDKIKNSENVKMLEFLKKQGDKVNPMTSSFDRLGYCLVSTNKYSKLKEELAMIEKEIKFEIID